MRLSDISSKTGQKICVFRLFWAYVGQPPDHISCAKPMPFASIISTIPRTNPWEFHEKILRIGRAGKWVFFWGGHFEFSKSAILNFLSLSKACLLKLLAICHVVVVAAISLNVCLITKWCYKKLSHLQKG